MGRRSRRRRQQDQAAAARTVQGSIGRAATLVAALAAAAQVDPDATDAALVAAAVASLPGPRSVGEVELALGRLLDHASGAAKRAGLDRVVVLERLAGDLAAEATGWAGRRARAETGGRPVVNESRSPLLNRPRGE